MFKRLKNETNKVEVREHYEIGNVVICAVRAIGGDEGVVGESYIHYLMYHILKDSSFKDLNAQYKFVLDEGRPVCKELHRVIKLISKDYSGQIRLSPQDEIGTPAIVTDIARGNYEEVKECEKWMVKYIPDVTPTVYMITPYGLMLAAYTWENLFSTEQKSAITEIAHDTRGI